jgi:hypothetical protein
VHDVKLLEPTLARIVVARPGPNEDDLQHFCADANCERLSVRVNCFLGGLMVFVDEFF